MNQSLYLSRCSYSTMSSIHWNSYPGITAILFFIFNRATLTNFHILTSTFCHWFLMSPSFSPLQLCVGLWLPGLHCRQWRFELAVRRTPADHKVLWSEGWEALALTIALILSCTSTWVSVSEVRKQSHDDGRPLLPHACGLPFLVLSCQLAVFGAIFTSLPR